MNYSNIAVQPKQFFIAESFFLFYFTVIRYRVYQAHFWGISYLDEIIYSGASVLNFLNCNKEKKLLKKPKTFFFSSSN